MEVALHTEDLTKVYRSRQRRGLFRGDWREVKALDGISLEVRPGEIFGLLGPNGAGKTTLIKILTTLLLPTSGRAWVNGYDVLAQPNAVRASVGCMLMGERGLYWKLTGRENLEYFGALYHLAPQERRRRVQEILDLLHLEDIADRTVETYSSGQKMKLAFGKALIHDAPILILDEPTNTLDVPSASELRSVVRQQNAQGKTVLYTTHIMAEAEALCDRVAIIDYGRLLAVGTVEELKAELQRDWVAHFVGVFPAPAVQALRELRPIRQVRLSKAGGAMRLTVVADPQQHDDLLLPVLQTLARHGARVQQVTPQEVTLEDVFIAKTGRTLAEDTRQGA